MGGAAGLAAAEGCRISLRVESRQHVLQVALDLLQRVAIERLRV
jgi:hypothetical protein